MMSALFNCHIACDVQPITCVTRDRLGAILGHIGSFLAVGAARMDGRLSGEFE
jgi:hypothetical protein